MSSINPARYHSFRAAKVNVNKIAIEVKDQGEIRPVLFDVNTALACNATRDRHKAQKTIALFLAIGLQHNLEFLPEHDYVTFGSLLSQIRLSVCRLSVTLVHPTQGLKLSAKFLHRCVRWPSSDLRAKLYGDSPRGTTPSGALNARGVSK